MRNRTVACLAALLSLAMIFTACAKPSADGANPSAAQSTLAPGNETPAAADWTLAIEGVDGKTEFTAKDAQALEVVTLEMTITNKNGESKTNSYTGVKLRDILSALGVTEVSSVSVVASDDFSADYPADLAMADDTLLAWAKDGEPLADHSLQMCPNGGTGNQFVKNTVKIIVTK